MSATLVARDVAARHGDRELFSGFGLVVAPGDVVGLVGANGAGKTTLLRLLAGLRPPDAGTVVVSPADARLGYLAQEPELIEGETAQGFLGRRTGVAAAQRVLNDAAEALGQGREGADDAYSQALEGWLTLGGADLETRLATVAADVGLPDLALADGCPVRR